jgi:hypothetical protein
MDATKGPRFIIPAGTLIEVRADESDPYWDEYTTECEMQFDSYHGSAHGGRFFRYRGYEIFVGSEFIIRPDLAAA